MLNDYYDYLVALNRMILTFQSHFEFLASTYDNHVLSSLVHSIEKLCVIS